MRKFFLRKSFRQLFSSHMYVVKAAETYEKRAHFTLMKLTPGVNFTNILWACFLYQSVLYSFSLLTDWLWNFFWQKNIGTKAALKKLVELTAGEVSVKKLPEEKRDKKRIRLKKMTIFTSCCCYAVVAAVVVLFLLLFPIILFLLGMLFFNNYKTK